MAYQKVSLLDSVNNNISPFVDIEGVYMSADYATKKPASIITKVDISVGDAIVSPSVEVITGFVTDPNDKHTLKAIKQSISTSSIPGGDVSGAASNTFLRYDGNKTYSWVPQSSLIGGRGFQGYQGPKGYQGPTGPIGPLGPTGSVGATGIQGPRGFQGYQGPATGIVGAQGPTGPQGPRGFQGYQGYQGPKGTDGTNGSQGPRGFQGYQGYQGPATGVTGPTGPRGYQGYQGPKGTDGTIGKDGSTGPQGSTGPRGFQGYQGPTGTPFFTEGYQGSTETQGDIGTDYTVYAPAFYEASDARMKTEIEEVPYEIVEKIINASPALLKKFRWIDSGNYSYGMIAQELEEIAPELVSTSDQDIKKVNYDAALSMICGALLYKIKEFEGRLKNLERH